MNKKLTMDEFIENFIKIHSDKYDYSLVEYKNYKTKIKIVCHVHGIFEQNIDTHLKGYGCSKCSGNNKKTTDEFIDKSRKIHGNKYDYSITEYKDCRTKIKIICPDHGIFHQDVHIHLKGYGCSKCGGNNRKTTDEFIDESRKIHGNKYDYSKSIYINVLKKIIIICHIHGEFYQTPPNHLHGNGCSKCKESKGEKDIRNYLIENNIKFESQKRFKDCKNIRQLSFDFYLSELNICIEYNGEQHYKSNKYFGGKRKFLITENNDRIKKDYCKLHNIKLITIRFDEDIINTIQKIFK